MRYRRTWYFALMLAAGGLLGGSLGCGSPTANVSGTITIDGKAPNLKGINIIFLTGNGKLTLAPVDEHGAYSAMALPVGEAKIGFIRLVPEAAGGGKLKAPLNPNVWQPPSQKELAARKAADPIPAKLREPSTSGISFKVQSGNSNVFDYNITKKEK